MIHNNYAGTNMDTIRKVLIGILIFLLLMLLEFVKPLMGQEREPLFEAGIYAAWNYNIYHADFRKLPGSPSCCPQYSSGNGTGFSFGGLFEMPIEGKWYAGVRLGYIGMDGELKTDDVIGNIELFNPNPPFNTITVTRATVEHTITTHISAVNLDPYIGYKPIENLSVFAGPGFAFLTSATFDQQEKLTKPDDLVFLVEKSKIRNKVTGEDIPEVNSFQAYLFVGAGYALKISNTGTLNPEIRYSQPLTDLSSVDWAVGNLSIGASLKFKVFEEEPILIRDTVYVRDTVEVEFSKSALNPINLLGSKAVLTSEINGNETHERLTIYEKYGKNKKIDPLLTVDFTVIGIDKNGKEQADPLVVIEEIETEEMFPLLPQVFYPEGEFELSKSSLALGDKESVKLFDEEKLEWNTLGIYSKMLDIIGSRMIKYPKAKLTVTGCNSNLGKEENNLALSEKRAENVKTYLTDVWGISPKRIALAKQNLPSKPANKLSADGIAENRRSEISSDDFRILAPVSLREIIKESDPPQVRITPAIFAESGLNNYDMSISQRGNILRNAGGKTPEPYYWDIAKEPIPLLETPAVISIDALDNNGKTARKEKALSIKQKTIKTKRAVIAGDSTLERFSLIVFDFDKAELTSAHKTILDEIKAKIKPGSSVIISGYTDRTGTAEYNRDLARRRTDEVKKYLFSQNAPLRMNAVGSDILIYDNNSPEGRSYCRTVKIEIKTPFVK